jgi:hypothetical protein
MSLSFQAQDRLRQLSRANELDQDYGYAYKLNSSNNLHVTDWGRRSKYEYIIGGSNKVLWVSVYASIWTVLWVSVYVRDFPAEVARPSSWALWARYPAKTFEDIPKLFVRYLGTAGLYKRVCYSVEEWEWSEQNGWEAADHV